MSKSYQPGRPRHRKGTRGKIADGLRAARAARGLSQEQAAEDLGISRSMLAMYETGAAKPTGLARRYIEEVWIPRALGAQQEDDR